MKKIFLTITLSALTLSACSKNDEINKTESNVEQELVIAEKALQKSGPGIEGTWSFCHDKTLNSENVIEDCQLYDSFLWQFENEAITVGKVIEPLQTENCTTQCYNATLQDVKVNNIANGFYSIENKAIIIDINDSKDLINFPTCQVKWNVINEVDELHQQWQLENVNCTTPIYDFKTWVKKVN